MLPDEQVCGIENCNEMSLKIMLLITQNLLSCSFLQKSLANCNSSSKNWI